MKDSQKTQPLFDKAVKEIEEVLNTGVVLDKAMMDVVMKSFSGHFKAKNIEVREDALRFVVNRSLSENIKELKRVLPKIMPEYVAK